jgi:hypothetical protein
MDGLTEEGSDGSDVPSIYDGPSEQPVWYSFIVSEEVDSWAVVMTYDEDYEQLYLWTAANDICQLELDYTNS